MSEKEEAQELPEVASAFAVLEVSGESPEVKRVQSAESTQEGATEAHSAMSTGSTDGPAAIASDTGPAIGAADANGNAKVHASAKEDTGDSVSREELLELVRAIKFAKPDASQRQVHLEITQELSRKESFQFLQHVQLNQVKKVWKKALASASSSSPKSASIESAATAVPKTTADSNKNNNDDDDDDDLKQKLKALASSSSAPLQLFTIGDGRVQHLAQEYTAAYVATQVAAERELEQKTLKQHQQQQRLWQEKYVHVYLDVPLNKTGSRPHQALINFQPKINPRNNEKSTSSSTATANAKKQRGKKGRKAAAPSSAVSAASIKPAASGGNRPTTVAEENPIIVKIQMAAPLPEEAAAATSDGQPQNLPMLLYNQDRSCRTFIHYDDAPVAYDTIKRWIATKGTGGVLGHTGGLKAYFYSRCTKHVDIVKNSDNSIAAGGLDILSIIISELAPVPASGW